MPDSMKILGWKAEGFRCPDHEVNCCDDTSEPMSISLIQMPNGTGKTTTLKLLRAALSGEAQTWPITDILELRKKNSVVKLGTFTLKLKLNGQLHTVIMELDFENQKVSYKTTGIAGQDNGFNPPRTFRKFMSPDFVNFYVFDGELAQNLLERDHTDAITVIEKLFQINLLDYLAAKINDYWDDQTRSVTAKDEKGRTQRLNTVVQLNQKLNSLLKAKAQLDEKKIVKETALEQKRKQYESDIANMQGHSTLLENKRGELLGCEDQIRTCSADVLHSMTNPQALAPKFAINIKNFKDSLDRVKLPETAAREFFEELAEEDYCVCGRPIDDTIRKTIKERAEKYLGSDEYSLLNSMKTSIDEAVNKSTEDLDIVLNQKIENLTTWVRARESIRNDIHELELEAEGRDPKIAEAKEEIDKLEAEITDIDSQLLKFQDGKDRNDSTTDIEILRSKVQQAIIKLAEITNTLELKRKRDILHSILKTAAETTKEAVIKEICEQTNQRITELMPYNNIKLDSIDRCLILEGQRGGSAGEQLSIAYAFLATLFNSSDQTLPFIVDSPAGAIDYWIRPKIADLVPKLSNQFIAFIISTERDGFVSRLASASNNHIQYITLFRKGISNIESSVTITESWNETDDGFLVEDESFFNAFQIETEEE